MFVGSFPSFVKSPSYVSISLISLSIVVLRFSCPFFYRDWTALCHLALACILSVLMLPRSAHALWRWWTERGNEHYGGLSVLFWRRSSSSDQVRCLLLIIVTLSKNSSAFTWNRLAEVKQSLCFCFCFFILLVIVISISIISISTITVTVNELAYIYICTVDRNIQLKGWPERLL